MRTQATPIDLEARITQSLRVPAVRNATTARQNDVGKKQIEDYPAGYPRFSALLGSHSCFRLSRKFATLRERLLLVKQFRVSALERRLEEIDRCEERPLFLGSLQRDRNADREAVLKDLDNALADYDALLERSARIFNLIEPKKKDRLSLLNWVIGNGSISREETEFLCEDDLCAHGELEEGKLHGMENLVERGFVLLYQILMKPLPASISRDKRVFIFTRPAFGVITRLLTTWLVAALLIVPVSVMRAIDSGAFRLVCVAFSSGLFTLSLTSLTNAKASETFIGSATYTALLVVFLQGSNTSS